MILKVKSYARKESEGSIKAKVNKKFEFSLCKIAS